MPIEDNDLRNSDEGIDEQLDSGLEVEGKESEESEASGPDNYDLVAYPADIQLQDYFFRWKRKEFHIPHFQRKYVWDVGRASKFIESFLLGLPVPVIFWYMDKEKSMILDGQQRVISIVSFINGEFVAGEKEGDKFSLKGVHDEWKGKTFDDLDESLKNKFKNFTMRAMLVEPRGANKKNNKRAMYEVFRRLNTGGVSLNPMEVRLCIEENQFVNLLKEINEESKEWRVLMGKEFPDKRCKDLELMLRFFALHEGWKNYKPPMKAFLDDYLANNQNQDEKWINSKRKLLEETVKKALSIRDTSDILKKIKNLSILDSLLVALADSKTSDAKTLTKFYTELLKDEKYIEIVNSKEGTAGTTKVQKRIKIAKEKFKNG